MKKEVDDILHNKAELLSLADEKGRPDIRRFLLSKWTLKEGWDNPNVFTIAKLRSSGSENSKLQEVGRGLRLPVDEYGNRIKDEAFYLNYIVDFTERDFADRLVMEINEDARTGMPTNIPRDERERVAELRGITETELFIALLTKGYIGTDGVIKEGKAMDLFAEYPEFNNVRGKEMRYDEFLKRACRQTSIPMGVLHKAICDYAKTHKVDGYINGSSLSALITKFNGWKIKNLQNLVKYRQANYSSKSTAFTNADGSLKEEVLLWTIGKNVLSAEPSKRYLYDKVVYDSPLERENIMNEVDSVIVYGKIPQRSICIPNITNDLYSPDFMYVVQRMDGRKELNIVIETKDVPNDEAKRTIEDAKINNAERFFRQLKIDGYDVRFCRQLQSKKMANIISELLEEDAPHPA